MKFNSYTVVNRYDKVSEQANVVVDEYMKEKKIERDDDNPELVIAIGGDGTFLHAVHKYLDKINDVYFISVHTGTLGFFASYHINELNVLMNSINEEKSYVDSKALLEVEAVKNDGKKEFFYAVNEMRIENVYKTQIIKVWVNKSYLETFRGTGLCLSTQAGSTGFNKSLKGAVVQDSLEIMQMTEISGIHNKVYQSLQVPLLLDKHAEVTYGSSSFEEAVLCYDYKSVDMKDIKHVLCRLSDKKVNMLRYREKDFVHKIKDLF